MSRLPDDTLQRVLEKIQLQVYQTNQQLAALRAQINSQQREAKLNTLTLTELQGIQDPNTPFYRSVGKMFISDTQQNVIADLEKKQKEIAGEIEASNKKQKYLQKQGEDAQAHLKDIFSSVRQQQQQTSS